MNWGKAAWLLIRFVAGLCLYVCLIVSIVGDKYDRALLYAALLILNSQMDIYEKLKEIRDGQKRN